MLYNRYICYITRYLCYITLRYITWHISSSTVYDQNFRTSTIPVHCTTVLSTI